MRLAFLQRGSARLKWLVAPVLALALSACQTAPKIDIDGPTTARPIAPVAYDSAHRPTGGIFTSAQAYRPLFEDVRARAVGDTLVVVLEERINSTQTNNTSTQRTNNSQFGVNGASKVPFGGLLRGLGVDMGSDSKFQGQGATGASNALTGTITVTVTEVLANGNLRVSGEKQIGTNRETERIRFSGVVNPALIIGANTVSSTQVADARIEYRGQGVIDEAQTVGWLSRFFNSWLPF